MASQTLKSLN